MRLTTARYYTPSGRSIQATGIVPDIEVQPATVTTLAMPRFQRSEANLPGALGNDTNSDDPATDTKEEGIQSDDADTTPAIDAEADEAPPEDYQLRRAVDLLQGIALYQRASLN